MLQNLIDEFKKHNKNDKVLIYGAGKFSFSTFNNLDLSGINIVGVIDQKFEKRLNNKFFNIPAFSPKKLKVLDFDTLFVFLERPDTISDILQKIRNLGKKVILFNETKVSFDKYNDIILVENGVERKISEKELPHGFKITYTNDSRNNVLKIELPQNFSNVNVDYNNVKNCTFEIMSTKYIVDQLFIHFGESSDMKIKINKNISVVSAFIYTNQAKSEIEIGEDCMLASDVKIVGGDGHSIYDLSTGKLINVQKNKLSIGNHVWLGDHSRIMKNAVVANGSVVGANSVVVKKFDEQNAVIAGNPAKVVKNNIYWDRCAITDIDKTIDFDAKTDN